jgi:hypothetical protein
MVVKADGAGNLPNAISVLPQRNELCFSHFIVVPGVLETMNTDLHSAIVGNRIDLQCSSHKWSHYFAADVVPYAVEKCLTAAGQASPSRPTLSLKQSNPSIPGCSLSCRGKAPNRLQPRKKLC